MKSRKHILARWLVRTPARLRVLFLLTFDILAVPAALLISLAVMIGAGPALTFFGGHLPVIGLLVAVSGAFAHWLGIAEDRLGGYDPRAIARTGLLALLTTLIAAGMFGIAGSRAPVATYILMATSYFSISVGVRLLGLAVMLRIYRNLAPLSRVLIYGAGRTGLRLAAAIEAAGSAEIIGFVDDNPALQSIKVAGRPVYPMSNIAQVLRERAIGRVLIAIPSLSRARQMALADRLQEHEVSVLALPHYAGLLESNILGDLVPVSPSHLLGRRQIRSELDGLARAYSGETVLVSGAGGSIGAELCRQLMESRPARLVLLENAEGALYDIERELRPLAQAAGVALEAVLGSAGDPRIVKHVLRSQHVTTVFHAAAYKHVPIVETNVLAGVENNVLGTRVLAEASAAAGISRFILVSTDKAVRPQGVMGATKRMAEMVVQDIASRATGTVFAMVRFGNVLGSSGSVVPLFMEQISRGGPITLTHEEVERYFMTVSEAAKLVLVAGGLATGGEVFVLNMGRPIPLRMIARKLIAQAGLTERLADNPRGDIEIVTTGLRPGEKLREELLIGDNRLPTPHPQVTRVREQSLSEIEIANAMRELTRAVEATDANAARETLMRWVAERTPEAGTLVQSR